MKRMHHRAPRPALLAACVALALASPAATADEISDLKAEIQAQRAQLEAQRTRLESLEKKLDLATATRAAAPTTPAATTAPTFHGALGAPGDGYTFHITPEDAVTLYGLLDVIAVDRNHANGAGDHKRSLEIGWFSGSRWGISGFHGLGPDLRAIYKLESEIEIPTGAEDTPGVLFNRDAWVGFQGGFGKLTIGRQNALPRDISAIYGDPYGAPRVTTEEGGYTNSNNFKQLIYYAASATGTRYDRGIVWKNEFGPFVAGLAYQFGGVAGNMQEGSSTAIAGGYNSPGDFFHVSSYYTQFKVGGLQHKDWSIGGNIGMGIARLYGGYYKDDTEQGAFGKRKDHAWTVSTKIAPPGPMDYELGYQIIHADNAAVNSAGFILLPYNNTATAAGTATGDKKTLYGSIFYHFDRRIEIYLAADYAKLTGGYKLGSFNGYDNQTEIALGTRMRF